MKNLAAFLGSASLALVLPAAPAHAGGDITNFKVQNCARERIFVCSYDKTDGSLKIPYKARGISQANNREFGCASLNKCKVIIGVSKKKPASTLSEGVTVGLSSGAVIAGTVAGFSAVGALGATAGMAVVANALVPSTAVLAAGASTVATLTAVGVTAAVLAVAAGGTVAAFEIADGWSDGEVCNQARRAAQKAGMKTKSFMKDGQKYQVIEQYATDANGNYLINPDGTAVFTYKTRIAKDSCPKPLPIQLVANP